MFSQWRQAVEGLSQHSPKPSQDSQAEDNSRSSLDSLGMRPSVSSSSQLAESALTNLRKSLAAQRPASPGTSRTAVSPAEGNGRRTTLEDRLRAKFAIGEASNGTSPNPSSKTSRAGTPVTDHPLSPTSTPLPESPAPKSGKEQDRKRSQDEDKHMHRVSEKEIPLSPTSAPLPDSPVVSPLIAAPVPLALASFGSPLSTSVEQTLSPGGSVVELSLDAVPGSHTPGRASSTELVCQGTPGAHGSNDDQPTIENAEDPEAQQEEEHRKLTSLAPHGVSVDATEAQSPPGAGNSLQIEKTSPVETSEEDVFDPPVVGGNRSADKTLVPESPEEAADAPPSTPLQSDEAVQQATKGDDGAPDVVPQVESPAPAGEGVVTTEDVPANTPNGDAAKPPSTPATKLHEADIEGLQQRLRLVEQRFADVSTSFKRLQAEKLAADRVLRELTPLEAVHEIDALRDYLQNMTLKTEMAQDEIKRLNGKLIRQEERIEELRDTHRLESKSQSDQIHKLRAQVAEAEALLNVSQTSTSQLKEDSAKRAAEVQRLQSEAERMAGAMKEEEEKRIKAVALLKTVRQKLVKAEKERDDGIREVQLYKEKEKEDRDTERAEKQRLQSEIDRVNAERETAVLGLRAQFDKETTGLKERYEKEISALRGQFELEIITMKSSHSKELDAKNSRISSLESLSKTLTNEKDEIFDQLQMRQAELESSQSHLESLQSQTTELRYQLREANDRIALLTEELLDARREQESNVQGVSTSPEEVTRLLSAAEAKFESRIMDLRRQLHAIERERDEGEAEWSRKLSEKLQEAENLKDVLKTSARSREEEAEAVDGLKKEVESLQEELRVHERLAADLRAQASKVTDIENVSQTQLADLNDRLGAMQRLCEESKAREAQLRAHNKTLREELRKVQSSAALLERQRHPGVGYWASRPDGSSETRSPRSSVSDLAARESPSRPGSPATSKSDEEVNFEYLRNVILQFLEHKEMRPNLIRILSTILHFTPQETRRLVAKV